MVLATRSGVVARWNDFISFSAKASWDGIQQICLSLLRSQKKDLCILSDFSFRVGKRSVYI